MMITLPGITCHGRPLEPGDAEYDDNPEGWIAELHVDDDIIWRSRSPYVNEDAAVHGAYAVALQSLIEFFQDKA